jgi:phosphoribosyl-ATP pyrophosphohydrolase/phosphoribosyl-AMP cyclohydrolase
MTDSNIEFLATLENIIRQRLEDKPDDSYTAQLVAQGDKRVAQKLGEEAIELALATTAGDRNEQIDEAADLVYHLLVLLASKGLSIADVAEKLRQRHES